MKIVLNIIIFSVILSVNTTAFGETKQEFEKYAEDVLKRLEAKDISSFLAPDTSESKLLEYYYSTQGLFGMSTLKCTRLHGSKINRSHFEPTNALAEVEFETGCVTEDKAYLSQKTLHFKKLENEWRVYLK